MKVYIRIASKATANANEEIPFQFDRSENLWMNMIAPMEQMQERKMTACFFFAPQRTRKTKINKEKKKKKRQLINLRLHIHLN
jgi:hypothetical protein